MHVCVYAYIYTYIHVHTYIDIHTFSHTNMHTYIHCILQYLHTYTHINMHTYIYCILQYLQHTHTHTHANILVCSNELYSTWPSIYVCMYMHLACLFVCTYSLYLSNLITSYTYLLTVCYRRAECAYRQCHPIFGNTYIHAYLHTVCYRRAVFTYR